MKTKGSRNRVKIHRQIARLQERVANRRFAFATHETGRDPPGVPGEDVKIPR